MFVKLKDGVEPTDEIKNYIYAKLESGFSPSESTRPLKSFEIPASMEFVSKIKRTQDSEKLDFRFYEEEAKKEYEENKKTSKTL